MERKAKEKLRGLPFPEPGRDTEVGTIALILGGCRQQQVGCGCGAGSPQGAVWMQMLCQLQSPPLVWR